ncbi:hypothetical protein CFC21_097915 [Triticum aestivum]|uniref:Uncharacterized protein n=3 Tax=Triticum TaxID=4564 RepID=A0A9R0ZCD8_TRITD|nr:hypothetical protein CFC21_097915 [Triticum aestivum]VAI75342.1 unnamed protein product [Triticum turgidum subsp. durum]
MRQPRPLRAAGAASNLPPCASIPQSPRCVVANSLFPIAASSNSFHGSGKSLISSGRPWSFRYMQNRIRAPCSHPKFC